MCPNLAVLTFNWSLDYSPAAFPGPFTLARLSMVGKLLSHHTILKNPGRDTRSVVRGPHATPSTLFVRTRMQAADAPGKVDL